MAKILTGKVVSTSMIHTILVEVTRQVPHPLYRKLLKRSKKFKADTADMKVKVGDNVTIVEIKPMSKDKHFALKSIINIKGEGK